MLRKVMGGLTAALLLAGCAQQIQPPTVAAPAAVPPEKITIAGPPIIKLDQGWKDGQAQWYYHTSQGSQVMPYAWFMALEMPASTALFRADGLKRYGYLPDTSTDSNPDLLPVGFALDKDKNGAQWLGMTCAACHTSRFEYDGKYVQVDGGPGQGDLYSLITDLAASMTATLTDEAKFDRFAKRIYGPDVSKEQMGLLQAYLAEFNGDFHHFVKASYSKTAWGRARTDAFGMIFNRVSAIDMKFPPNNQSPEAPVSYPHLWTSWRFDAVQWDAAVPNGSTLKNLGRNAGEVLGVFGKAELRRPTLLHPYYTSTVRTKNLLAMENQLWSLQAPKWPALMFGAPDPAKVTRGAKVYGDNCQGCHQQVPAGTGIINVVRIPLKEIGTDPTMATRALSKRWSVQLTGTAMPPIVGTKLKQEDLGVSLLTNAVVGSLIGSVVAPGEGQGLPKLWKKKSADGAWKATATGHYDDTEVYDETASADQLTAMHADLKAYQEEVQVKQAAANDLLIYKARPLDGIWATGPFLHNGSVPTLYALLNSNARPAKFKVGTQSFDPVAVGFKDDGEFEFDTSLPGNGNAGHTYGDTLTEQQRTDLIEYLKSL